MSISKQFTDEKFSFGSLKTYIMGITNGGRNGLLNKNKFKNEDDRKNIEIINYGSCLIHEKFHNGYANCRLWE